MLNGFKNKKLLYFFLSDFMASFGAGMGFLGANWFLLEKTGTNSSLGFMLTVNLVSGLVIFPFVGYIVDSFNRKKTIFVLNAARIVGLLAIVVALKANALQVGFLYVLAIINGTTWLLYSSASRSLVQELLQPGQLITGNSFVEISLQVGMFAAAGLAGVLYKYRGFEAVILVNAAFYTAGNLLLAMLRYNSIEFTVEKEGFAANFSAGLAFLSQNRSLFLLGVVSFIPLVATMTFNVVLPGYVSNHLNEGPVVFGSADMCYGIGGFVSGFIIPFLTFKVSRYSSVLLLYAFSILSQLFLVVNGFVGGLFASSLVFGFANSSLRIVMNSFLMEIVPKAFMGRAMSVWMAISLVLQALSVYGVGILMDHTRPAYGFAEITVVLCAGLLGNLLQFVKIQSQLCPEKIQKG